MLINSFECLNGKGIKTRANDKGRVHFDSLFSNFKLNKQTMYDVA